VLGKRGRRRVATRRGTISPDAEPTFQISEEEFFELTVEQLLELADKVGVSLQGTLSIKQARTRLLNDATFIHV
jgi:hypothetical protein